MQVLAGRQVKLIFVICDCVFVFVNVFAFFIVFVFMIVFVSIIVFAFIIVSVFIIIFVIAGQTHLHIQGGQTTGNDDVGDDDGDDDDGDDDGDHYSLFKKTVDDDRCRLMVMIKMPQVGNTLREAKWHFLPSIEVFQNSSLSSVLGTAHIMTNLSTGWPLA